MRLKPKPLPFTILILTATCLGFIFGTGFDFNILEEPQMAQASADTQPAAVATVEEVKSYTDEELETLALIIYQEAGSDECSDSTRIMVGNVVMNRVASDLYPDTIEEVATQPAQYGLLAKTGLVWPDRATSDAEMEAVQRAYNCAARVLGGETLLPSDVIYQAEFKQGSEVVVFQDGFYFCR